ncbi:MAG: type II toxin-antitoxin system Phd/YefM family antitoxin [Longimicrobiales bacterium]
MVCWAMESMPISKFKATCLAVLERVRRTGKPVLITRFGEPVAEVVPPRAEAGRAAWLGALVGQAELRDDLIEPAQALEEWEALEP